jgi:outer membrane lipoprotein-sorting protein
MNQSGDSVLPKPRPFPPLRLFSLFARCAGAERRPACVRDPLIRLFLALTLCGQVALRAEEGEDPILSAWLEAHQRLKTWSAEVIQTRHLTSLVQPLVTTGHVYFARPGLFRWELGQPPETIAIRSTNEFVLLYPALQRAETYSMDDARKRSLGDVLILMDAGFPKDEHSLREQYAVSTSPPGEAVCRIILTPRRPAARKIVSRVTLEFEPNRFTLRKNEIEFADGSRLINEFRNTESNSIPALGLFSTEVPPGYATVRPLER